MLPAVIILADCWKREKERTWYSVSEFRDHNTAFCQTFQFKFWECIIFRIYAHSSSGAGSEYSVSIFKLLLHLQKHFVQSLICTSNSPKRELKLNQPACTSECHLVQKITLQNVAKKKNVSSERYFNPKSQHMVTNNWRKPISLWEITIKSADIL